MSRRVRQRSSSGSNRKPSAASGSSSSKKAGASRSDKIKIAAIKEIAEDVFVGSLLPTPDTEDSIDSAAVEVAASAGVIFDAARVQDDGLHSENFDEVGYLRLNPDVKRAIELGQIESGYLHYVWHGRAEGRPLPNSPREARNVMIAMSGETVAGQTLTEARCSIDALIIAPSGGLMVVGWIDDATQALNCLRIIGPDWRVVIDASRFFRVRRADVEQAIGVGRLHPFGFIGFLHFTKGGEAQGPVKVELWQEGGASTTRQITPMSVESVELRDTILAHLAAASYFGNAAIESQRYLENGVGAELVRFNKAITNAIVAAPYVERFGPSHPAPRGSIIVCLYGKPEFFFVQNCLYSGLPGIEDYEFVYVSNSPEMAETLLHEARSASLIYGLRTTVVILPGNAGFGAANNVAAQASRSNRLLIVNPDVFPRDLDWAKKHTDLIASAPRAETQIFGAPLYYDDGSLMHGGMYFEVDAGLSLFGGKPSATRICRTQHYGKGAPSSAVHFTAARPVPAISGAFISVERSWYENLGGFTEDFIFGHYEDADICLKSLERGVAPWMQDIKMWHLEGKGSTRRPHHEGGSIVNRWLFSSVWMQNIVDHLIGPSPNHPLMNPAIAEVVSTLDGSRGKRRAVK